MYKAKVFLSAVAVGCGLSAWYLGGMPSLKPDLSFLYSSGTSEIASVITKTDASPVTLYDGNGNPMSGVSLKVTYLSPEGIETVSQVTTNADGSVDLPAADGIYTYALSSAPAGYSISQSKVIVKVEDGSVLAPQTMTMSLMDGSDRSDAVQNPSDEIFGATIGTEDNQEDLKLANAVTKKIDQISEVSEETRSQIVAAREAYNNLSNLQKGYVPTDSLKKLADAEKGLTGLDADQKAADQVAKVLDALPEVTELTQASTIEAAANQYNSLTDSQKSYVPSSSVTKLTSAQVKIEALRQELANVDNTTDAIMTLGAITSLDQKADVQALRKQYEALSESERAKISSETLKTLTDAEAKIAALQKNADDAAAVDALITELGSVSSLDQKEDLDAVKKAYDALSAEAKALVPETSVTILEANEARLAQLQEDQDKAAAFKQAANALPAISTIDQRSTVEALRAQYDALTQTQQALISNSDYAKLQKAENTMDKLIEAENERLAEEAAKQAAEDALKSEQDARAAAEKAAAEQAAAEKAAQEAAAKAAEEAAKAAQNTETEKPNVAAGDIEGWRPWVIKALEANGLSTSDELVNKVLRQINTESGGDQNIVQFITDSNSSWVIDGYHCDGCSAGGGQSKNIGHGLMQTIITTFDAYKFEGHNDIFNGYDNLLAALNYAKNRYGSNLDGLGEGHGY